MVITLGAPFDGFIVVYSFLPPSIVAEILFAAEYAFFSTESHIEKPLFCSSFPVSTLL